MWSPGGLLESCWDNIGRKVEELLQVVNSLVGEVVVVPVPVEALGDEAVSKSTRSTTSRHEYTRHGRSYDTEGKSTA